MSAVAEDVRDNVTPLVDYDQYPKAQQKLERQVDRLIQENPGCENEALEMLTSSDLPRTVTIKAPVAAAIHRSFNKYNRKLSMAKAEEYAAAMQRGEWKFHHQGLGVLEGGELGDGQHRCAAIVLSGRTQRFPLAFMDRDSADAIDQHKTRTAADALLMHGVADATLKANICKTATAYAVELELGRRGHKPSVIQVEQWVDRHSDKLDTSIKLARASRLNVSDPVMSEAEAASIAFLMLEGGYGEWLIDMFLASVQQGRSTYPDSPTNALSKMFLKARVSKNREHVLSKRVKLALSAKAASSWAQQEAVTRLVWKDTKESLPAFTCPSEVKLTPES